VRDVDDALDTDGGLSIQVTVKMDVRERVMAVERMFANCFDASGMYISEPFGEEEELWILKADVSGGVNSAGNTCMSVYIEPVKNEVEVRMGTQWRRVITGVTVKLVHGNKMNIASKIFTGSFIFSEGSEVCGWASFVASDSLVEAIEGYSLFVSITIDPKANVEHLTAPLIETVVESKGLEEEMESLRETIAVVSKENREAKRALQMAEGVYKYSETLKGELERSHAQIDEWKKIVSDLKAEVFLHNGVLISRLLYRKKPLSVKWGWSRI
jgi:hypothetical protein